jgi:pimeloyl-ACP methyl ester carboxylesterase
VKTNAPDPSSTRLPGPWTHRDISANGIRLHIAEMGSGPLVLLLHGFGQFWWTWHEQLPALAEAGYHAVAVDMRGFGDSDKPPRGYDGWTLGGDIAGLIKTLGAKKAHLVGHSIGGLAVWGTAALHPRLVESATLVSSAHPLALVTALKRTSLRRTARNQLRAMSSMITAQIPMRPERYWTDRDAAKLVDFFANGSHQRWPDFDHDTAVFRNAIQVPGTVHCSLEYQRWLLRSQLRSDGRRYRIEVDRRLEVPTLQIHGTADPYLLRDTALASRVWAGPNSTFVDLDGVGHFPHLESAERVSESLVGFLKSQVVSGVRFVGP